MLGWRRRQGNVTFSPSFSVLSLFSDFFFSIDNVQHRVFLFYGLKVSLIYIREKEIFFSFHCVGA